VGDGGWRARVCVEDRLFVQPYVWECQVRIRRVESEIQIGFLLSWAGEDLMDQNLFAGGKPRANEKFVVNLYGRYCNANKFAGEIDLLESARCDAEAVSDRRGSRGGDGIFDGWAAAWQFACITRICFVRPRPGGFSETKFF